MSAITSAGMMQDSLPIIANSKKYWTGAMRQEQRPHVPPFVASQQPVPGLTASQHVGY
jgi:hypothetical protein